VAGDIRELFATQPTFVKEVGGDAEAMLRQPLILAWRTPYHLSSSR
jgi:hypothetical protein